MHSFDVDIDHMVPLGEAWDSGASAWTDAERRAYANDLDDERSLAAVRDSINQSKADRGPTEWMPLAVSAHGAGAATSLPTMHSDAPVTG
ncbi:hypothetical protein [Streptomyces tricolor]|uniref:hypothetical protein n=1 Tax=Streptomyces tricolor TaxID=68277 RepID=UPI0036E1E2FE